MKVVIEIDCDNAAFDPCPHIEVSTILSIYATRLTCELPLDAEPSDWPTRLLDTNGNTVGKVEVKK